jgi:hypothetical protein
MDGWRAACDSSKRGKVEKIFSGEKISNWFEKEIVTG